MKVRTITAAIVGASFALATVVSMAYADSGTVVYGTPKRDIIRTGNGGLTTVYARGGNDAVHGGRGTDVIHGGSGNDHLWTGDGGAKPCSAGVATTTCSSTTAVAALAT
jgi:Ca2+-binding RTX toxin-like protein